MSKLLINENPLLVLPSLAMAIGLERAIIIQQIHFLLSQPKSGKVLNDGHKYVWNTYEDWQKEYFPFISTPDAVRKHFNRIEAMGLLVSVKPNAYKHDHTKFYRIDYENFDALAESNRTPSPHPDTDSQSTSERTPSPILLNTETTTDTTTEVNSPPQADFSLSASTRPRERLEKESRSLKHDELFETLASVCSIDWKLCTDKQRGMLNQTCGILRKNGKQPEDIKKVGEYWYGRDWRGKNGQPPSPEQVREVWQAALEPTREGQGNGNNGRRPTEAENIEAIARYQSERRAREHHQGDSAHLPYADVATGGVGESGGGVASPVR